MRILFLDLDTLRPDHLGCYGYHRATSPNIDALAAQGVRFTNYYCSDAPCLPSRAALVSGRFGIHTGVVGHGGTAADMRCEGPTRSFGDRLRVDSLFALVRSAGLWTCSISPFAERHSAWWFYAGLSEMHNPGKRGMESAEDVTPLVLDWIARNGAKDNWFLHVNYWDPHTPYRAPDSFGNPFADQALPEWLTEEVVAKHQNMTGPHTALELYGYRGDARAQYPRYPGQVRSLADARRMIDGYDCGIRYMDEHIGRVLSAFEQQGVLDDLVILISADHGENLAELGLYAEHATADHITCRIPMIIRWPGCHAGHVDDGLHYNLDLAPTLAELLGKPRAPRWDGQSYAPAVLRGEACGRESLVISQCAHVCQRGVRMGSWMYTRTWHDGYYLFPDEMLFDLAADPHEQNNLAASRPDICREAVYRLNQWHDDMMRTMQSEADPMWTVIREGGPYHAKGFLREYCKRLEETGRGWAIEELKRRHPREFK